MIASLMPAIVALVIVGVILYLLELLPMEGTIKVAIRVLVIVVVVLWLINVLLGIIPMAGR